MVDDIWWDRRRAKAKYAREFLHTAVACVLLVQCYFRLQAAGVSNLGA